MFELEFDGEVIGRDKERVGDVGGVGVMSGKVVGVSIGSASC